MYKILLKLYKFKKNNLNVKMEASFFIKYTFIVLMLICLYLILFSSKNNKFIEVERNLEGEFKNIKET